MPNDAAAGRFALVTGANRGLGYEVARKLVASGRSVIITARDGAAGVKAADALRSEAAAPARVEALQFDASSAASIKALAAAVADKFDGQVDLLVNNAGILRTSWTAEGHEATMATNLDGAIDTTLALLPHLAKGARVVMVSSGLGTLGMLTPDYRGPIESAATLAEVRAAAKAFFPDSPLPGHNGLAPSYSVSKAALNRATQLLAADPAVKERGVSVVAVCPGWCTTDMGTSVDVPGRGPDRTPGQGADSILAAAAAEGGAALPTGSFSRDGKEVDLVTPAA